MSATAIDIDHLREWVGREQRVEQVIAPFPGQALAGLLDRGTAPGEGDALPLAWQWLHFLDTPSRSQTGVDGHPLRGGFLPPVPLPRRMWAAGQMESTAPLVVGERAEKVSAVRSVELKSGHSGPLVFVRVQHEFTQGGHACIREEQTLVYRDAPAGPAPAAPGEPAPLDAAWSREWHPDPVALFRYSALTYNGHRIHYDRDYATREEFYPALVVHGPLLATLLLDLVHRKQPARAVAKFEFRAMRPAFDTDTLRLCGRPDAAGAALWTADASGATGMTASVHWA